MVPLSQVSISTLKFNNNKTSGNDCTGVPCQAVNQPATVWNMAWNDKCSKFNVSFLNENITMEKSGNYNWLWVSLAVLAVVFVLAVGVGGLAFYYYRKRYTYSQI
jgi:hypothetical protein